MLLWSCERGNKTFDIPTCLFGNTVERTHIPIYSHFHKHEPCCTSNQDIKLSAYIPNVFITMSWHLSKGQYGFINSENYLHSTDLVR